MIERCKVCGKPIHECKGGILRCRRYTCVCAKCHFNCQFYRDDGLCYWWCSYPVKDKEIASSDSK
nr:MAG TPA: zinc-ribbon domain protein [Caudoviricetes sp.]